MTSPSAPTPAPPSSPSSSAETTPDPDRPDDVGQAALYDAVAAEHAAIYGYGVVSAHSLPIRNDLVSAALAEHRKRREQAVSLLAERSVPVPLPAIGYQLPSVVDSPTDAARLAVLMENDCAVAWRAVLEQTDSEQDREFAGTALTQCAVVASLWREVLGAWPVTEAFPGGGE